MNPRIKIVRGFVIGAAIAALVGLTTDQILQNVYDSTNTALRANVVVGSVGGATPVPVATATPLAFGTSGVVAIFSSPELGSYAGASCGSGFVTATTTAWGVTCATPVPPTPVATATPQPTATPRSPTYRSTGRFSSGSVAMNGGFTDNFIPFNSEGTTTLATLTTGTAIVPIATTVKNMLCYLATAPASTTSWAFTLETGTCGSTLSNTAITCTITGNGSLQTCSDTTHSASITAGQCASVDVVPTNNPTNSIGVCRIEIDP